MSRTSPMLEKGEQFFEGDMSLYVNRVSERFDLPVHEHDFIEICYVWAGTGFHYIEDQVMRVRQGDLFFLPIGVSHIFRPASARPKEPLMIGNCVLGEQLFRFLTSMLPAQHGLYRFRKLLAGTDGWFRMREKAGEFGALFDDLLREFESKRTGYETMMCGLLLQLLIGMERTLEGEPEPPSPSARLDAVRQYVRDRLHGALSLSEAAERAGIGARQLQRLLRSRTGQTFTDFVQKERIDRSCRLLTDPSLSSLTVADIASRVGLSDPKRFHLLFKRATGTTPARYRLEKSR
ncbi:AraC family transcriptional regulator [Cohnella zeiphila]|uniref:Helix-turn-helix transcriptional regulator n=1 Tax=Cohnella zeiphila TaxID=2761120 RepID=A0A7X0STJ9_9BACL|nr:AraC family transcriptional regulator [Cohnella zeiphila]MBB6734640.1 helix-turn-helix transcriptional regulator [Cohnella zeiphila]